MTNFRKTVAFSGAGAAKRGAEKKNLFFRWLWRWKFADSHIIQKLWGVGYKSVMATIANYEKNNLIGRVKTPGMPSNVFYLKKLGAEYTAELMIETRWFDMKPAIYPSDLGLKQVQHDLAVQYLIMDLQEQSKLNSGDGLDIINDRQLRFNNNEVFSHGKKIPDALIRYKNGDLFAVEMVETMYDTEERKRVIWLHAEAQASGKIVGTIYASTRKSYLRLLQTAANEGCGSWKYLKDKKQWINDENGIKYVNQDYIKNHLIFNDLSEYRNKLYTL